MHGVAYAEQAGVQILLENQCKDYHGHLVRGICADGRQAAEWIDALNELAGEERFGFCMDVGICNLCGQNMYDFALALGSRLKAVILRDCNGNTESALLPFTGVKQGQSQTDWLNLIRGLREIGFDGKLVMNMADTAAAFSPILRPELLRMAKFLGSEEMEWSRTEEFIESIAPMAKEMGITICIENLYESVGSHLVEGPCCDVRKAVERIDRINDRYHAEVLGFCFDTGHANLVGIDFEDFITGLGERLKVLHIHDNDGISDLHQIPFTFTKTRENNSSTDWDGFIRGMRNIGFNRVLSFETAPVLSAFPEVMKQDALEFIARIGKYFEGEIGMPHRGQPI